MNPKLKSIFSKILPTIAATIVPGGPLAQMGINVLSQALGGAKVDPTPDAMDAAIIEAQKTNPNILLDLKKADADLQVRLAEMGYDSEEKILALQTADAANARAREIAVKDHTPEILAYCDLAAFILAFAGLLFIPVPATIHDLLLLMVGQLGANVYSERNYFFGSSSGSAAKTAILADQTKNGK